MVKSDALGPAAGPTRRQILLAAILLEVALVVTILATFRDYGISWDEPIYVFTGKVYFENWGHLDRVVALMQERYRGFGPDFWKLPMATHGALMDVVVFAPLALLQKPESFAALHLVKALIFSLAAPAVVLTLGRIARTRLVPLAGGLFLALAPRWYGDIFDNHMDGLSTLLYAAGILSSVRLLAAERARERIPYLLASAAVAGMAISHRSVLACLPASLALPLLYRLRRRPAQAALLLGAYAATFAGSVAAFDPYIRSQGWRGFADKFRASSALPWPHEVLFEGRISLATGFPRRYIPEWIAISTPPVTLLLCAAGAVVFLWRCARPGHDGPRTIAAFVLSALALPLAACVVLRPTVYDGWRHLLFLSVPIALMAAVALDAMLAAPRRDVRVAGVLLAAFGFLTTGMAMVRLHPYQYTYFNVLVGGLPGAAGRYETDYWAKSYKEAAEWLRDGELAVGPPTKRVLACGPAFQAMHHLRGRAQEVRDPRRADYVICYTRREGSPAVEGGQVIHAVTREGVPLCTVRRMR